MSLRLIKFYPEQVASYWHFLSPIIESTLPPISSGGVDRMQKVLEAILAGNLEVLQFCDMSDGNVTVKGFVVVAEINNIDCTGKQLLIYSIYSYESVSKADIVDGLRLLKEYAKSRGCDAITAYTNLESLVKYVKRVGGSTTFTFLRLEV